MSKNLIKGSKGFTLIELLVVIAIIGILSSVVLASLSTARAKSRDARRISDLSQVQLALELYYDANATYPTTTAAATLYGFSAASTTGPGVPQLTITGLIPKLPSDPTTGASYYYCAQASSTASCGLTTAPAANYVLGANLERSDNTALLTDSDKVLTNFWGSGAVCTAATGPDSCFDISN